MAPSHSSKRKRKDDPPEVKGDDPVETMDDNPVEDRAIVLAEDIADGVITTSVSPVVVLAPGASDTSTSTWMKRWKEKLESALNAVEVVTFDYPYIATPNKLVNIHKDFVKDAVSKYPGHPLVLAGKSLGARVSCLVASKDDIPAKAVICLGYPLKATNGVLRDKELLQLTVPVMFVQGSGDAFCPLEKLKSVRMNMKCQNALHVIDGGNHHFKIAKKDLETLGLTQDEAEKSGFEAEDHALKAIASFVFECLNM